MFKLCTNKNHSNKQNEQINSQNIYNSECFGVKLVKIYPEMTSQNFFEKIWFCWLHRDFFLHVAILLATCCINNKTKIYGGHTSNTIQLFPNYLSSVKCFETDFSQVTLGYHYHLWQIVLVVLIETVGTVLLCICLEFNFKFFHLKWKLQQFKHFLSTNQGFFLVNNCT